MIETILVKLGEWALTKLGSLVYNFIIEFFAAKKDEDDINEAFENETEGELAAGLNDVFTR